MCMICIFHCQRAHGVVHTHPCCPARRCIYKGDVGGSCWTNCNIAILMLARSTGRIIETQVTVTKMLRLSTIIHWRPAAIFISKCPSFLYILQLSLLRLTTQRTLHTMLSLIRLECIVEGEQNNALLPLRGLLSGGIPGHMQKFPEIEHHQTH